MKPSIAARLEALSEARGKATQGEWCDESRFAPKGTSYEGDGIYTADKKWIGKVDRYGFDAIGNLNFIIKAANSIQKLHEDVAKIIEYIKWKKGAWPKSDMCFVAELTHILQMLEGEHQDRREQE